MLLTDPNHTKSEIHGDNGDNNRDGNRIGIEKRELDDLEDLE